MGRPPKRSFRRGLRRRPWPSSPRRRPKSGPDSRGADRRPAWAGPSPQRRQATDDTTAMRWLIAARKAGFRTNRPPAPSTTQAIAPRLQGPRPGHGGGTTGHRRPSLAGHAARRSTAYRSAALELGRPPSSVTDLLPDPAAPAPHSPDRGGPTPRRRARPACTLGQGQPPSVWVAPQREEAIMIMTAPPPHPPKPLGAARPDRPAGAWASPAAVLPNGRQGDGRRLAPVPGRRPRPGSPCLHVEARPLRATADWAAARDLADRGPPAAASHRRAPTRACFFGAPALSPRLPTSPPPPGGPPTKPAGRSPALWTTPTVGITAQPPLASARARVETACERPRARRVSTLNPRGWPDWAPTTLGRRHPGHEVNARFPLACLAPA